jgi:hypothetical protein
LVLHVHLVELSCQLPKAARQLLAPEEQVRDHVQVVAEGEVLIHGRDAEARGLGRRADRHGPALERHRAGVGAVDARDGLDERGLAGAVVADERHHLAWAHLEVDVLERLHGPEALADAL